MLSSSSSSSASASSSSSIYPQLPLPTTNNNTNSYEEEDYISSLLMEDTSFYTLSTNHNNPVTMTGNMIPLPNNRGNGEDRAVEDGVHASGGIGIGIQSEVGLGTTTIARAAVGIRRGGVHEHGHGIQEQGRKENGRINQEIAMTNTAVASTTATATDTGTAMPTTTGTATTTATARKNVIRRGDGIMMEKTVPNRVPQSIGMDTNVLHGNVNVNMNPMNMNVNAINPMDTSSISHVTDSTLAALASTVSVSDSAIGTVSSSSSYYTIQSIPPNAQTAAAPPIGYCCLPSEQYPLNMNMNMNGKENMYYSIPTENYETSQLPLQMQVQGQGQGTGQIQGQEQYKQNLPVQQHQGQGSGQNEIQYNQSLPVQQPQQQKRQKQMQYQYEPSQQTIQQPVSGFSYPNNSIQQNNNAYTMPVSFLSSCQGLSEPTTDYTLSSSNTNPTMNMNQDFSYLYGATTTPNNTLPSSSLTYNNGTMGTDYTIVQSTEQQNQMDGMHRSQSHEYLSQMQGPMSQFLQKQLLYDNSPVGTDRNVKAENSFNEVNNVKALEPKELPQNLTTEEQELKLSKQVKRREQLARAARRHRQRQKEELEYLKMKLSELEKQMALFKKRKQSNNVNDSVERNRILWKEEAKLQTHKRRKSEEENERLKAAIIEQMKFANVLEHVFREIPNLSVLPVVNHAANGEIWKNYKLTDSNEERQNAYHNIIDREYRELPKVLSDVGLVDNCNEVRHAKLQAKKDKKNADGSSIPSDGKEILEIQIVRHRIYYNVSYDIVANAAWDILSGQFDPKDLVHESPLRRPRNHNKDKEKKFQNEAFYHLLDNFNYALEEGKQDNSNWNSSDASSSNEYENENEPALHVCYPTEVKLKEDDNNEREDKGDLVKIDGILDDNLLSDDVTGNDKVAEASDKDNGWTFSLSMTNQEQDINVENIKKKGEIDWRWSEKDEKEGKITILETIDKDTIYLKRTDTRLVRIGGLPVESRIIMKRYYENEREVILWTSVLEDERYPLNARTLCGNQTGRLVIQNTGRNTSLKLIKTFTPPLADGESTTDSPLLDGSYSNTNNNNETGGQIGENNKKKINMNVPGVVTEAIMKMVMDQARRLEFILEMLTKNTRKNSSRSNSCSNAKETVCTNAKETHVEL